MGRVDQIDIVRSCLFQFAEDIGKALCGNDFAVAVMADLIILTEAAAEGAAGEKYRSGSACAADTRLLAEVQSGTGDNGIAAHSAKTAAVAAAALDAATTRT